MGAGGRWRGRERGRGTGRGRERRHKVGRDRKGKVDLRIGRRVNMIDHVTCKNKAMRLEMWKRGHREV